MVFNKCHELNDKAEPYVLVAKAAAREKADEKQKP